MSSEADKMPRHTVVEHLIKCSCGEVMPAYHYESHREREPAEIGRWIADRALDKLRASVR